MLQQCFFTRTSLSTLFIYLAAITNSSIVAEDFSTLMTKVPGTANAVIGIDADALRNSELGKKENWADKNEAAYVGTPFILPPEADKLLISSLLNPNDNFEQAWEFAVMSLTEPVSMRAIARAEGGTLDEIVGTPAVWTPAGVYFVQLSNEILGVMTPANRQLVARWAAYFNSPSQTDEYLRTAVLDVSETKQIVLAMDLKNAVNPPQLSKNLAESEFIQESKHDQKAWERVIKSLVGVKFEVSVTDRISGQLTVDFAVDPSPLGKDSKEAIILALGRSGAGVDSIESWNLSQSQNQLILQGGLSSSDFRKIMSLLELPGSDLKPETDVEQNSSSPAEKKTDDVAEASQKYFDSVDSLLRDLEGDFKTNRDVRHGFAASYMQRYAQRIDNLPILNVDDELINYGLRVSETLRDSSVVQGTSNLQAGVRKSSVYQSNNVYDYNSTYRSVSSMKTQIAREEQAVASTARFNNWKEIEDATAQMRVKMTKKYGVEF